MATKHVRSNDGATGDIRTGMGGWVFPPWRGVFYPEGLVQKRELEYASQKVGAIEINGTYYRAPDASTYEKWAAQTPEDFIFSVKAPRLIVQARALAGTGTRVRSFLDGAAALGARLGPLLWQFMPTRRFDPDDVAAFLDLLPEKHGGVVLRHAVEVRHESFMDERWLTLARERTVLIPALNGLDGGNGEGRHHSLFCNVAVPATWSRRQGREFGSGRKN